jgi:hypothetical protein
MAIALPLAGITRLCPMDVPGREIGTGTVQGGAGARRLADFEGVQTLLEFPVRLNFH